MNQQRGRKEEKEEVKEQGMAAASQRESLLCFRSCKENIERENGQKKFKRRTMITMC